MNLIEIRLIILDVFYIFLKNLLIKKKYRYYKSYNIKLKHDHSYGSLFVSSIIVTILFNNFRIVIYLN